MTFCKVFGKCASYTMRKPERLKIVLEALCCACDLDLQGQLWTTHRGLLLCVCRTGGAKLRYSPMSFRAAGCNACEPAGGSFARRTVEAGKKDICFLILIGNDMSRCSSNFRTQVLMQKAQRR